ncbi:MAG: NAD(P)H-dependent oxidoreductase [Eubacterium sp.]|nr:NAD(P)H-dependent oxidoreductase [Eubacterium sp.]
MKILILNGSPAGKDSITLQTMEYIQILFPDHEYETLPVAQKIRSMETDFTEAKAALEAAELILFCYPVYTFLVPAQLHRFIELIRENRVDLSGKYASQISTSKHFYDMTAHRFIEDACADLKLFYVRGLSADMEDILTRKGQKEARDFFRFLIWNIRQGFYERPSAKGSGRFTPVMAEEAPPSLVKDRLHAALVTDFDPDRPPEALLAMIRRFERRLPGSCEIVNLREFPFQGGCLGCFHCASDGKCIYKDGFDTYLREHINSADAVVFAYTIKDHSMGYRFKLYDDRQFCNGHRTVTMGKPVGYLVDGNLAAEENLRVLMEARSQVGGNFLAGIATDETDPEKEIDRLVKTLVYAVQHRYSQPKNFYGVGGLKIFRDLIFEMQGLMKEDHRFYKKHGFYDFPQKKMGRVAGMYLVSAMMNSEKIRRKIKFSMTDGMMLSYKKVLEKAKKERDFS